MSERPERRFFKFHFGWGYAEGQRICGGPTFYHAEGFENPLEALESFRLALVGYLREGKVGLHDADLSKVVDLIKQGVLPAEALPMAKPRPPVVHPGEVVELFSDMWSWTCDDYSARCMGEALEIHGWSDMSHYPSEPDPEQTISFVRTERWLEESPESSTDPEECEPYLESGALPWVGGFGPFPYWSSRDWKEWLEERRAETARQWAEAEARQKDLEDTFSDLVQED